MDPPRRAAHVDVAAVAELRRLEREGLVRREASGPSHAYHLTEAGLELAPIVRRLSRWGERWVLGHIDPRKADVTALMWAVRRRVDPSVFGDRRVTVQFEFTDQPQAKRSWWLVNEAAKVDLCPKDPGFEVDLYALTDLLGATTRNSNRFALLPDGRTMRC